MPHKLEFEKRYDYPPSSVGIEIPVEIAVGNRTAEFPAKIDTGAEYCVFERRYGELLDLDVDKGDPRKMFLANGQWFQTFGHSVKLRALDCEVDSMVYFAAGDEIRRNVLGRNGWLNKFRIAVIDHDSDLFLSHYDDD